MTERRFATTRPVPALTPYRDEAPRPACSEAYLAWRERLEEGRAQGFPIEPWAYDTLHDHASGWEYRAALKVASDLCGTCPLRAACLRSEDAKEWATGVRAELKRREKEAAA